MKSISILVISSLLVTAILAPSIITLIDANTKTELVMDFNEEDNKNEEKNENQENEFFSRYELVATQDLFTSSSKISSFYLQKNYAYIVSIFVPPPEGIG